MNTHDLIETKPEVLPDEAVLELAVEENFILDSNY